MPNRTAQVQPHYRDELLLHLPTDGAWKKWDLHGLVDPDGYDEEEDEFDDFDRWYGDRAEWFGVALKEGVFLGQIEQRRTGGLYSSTFEVRLTELGARRVAELKSQGKKVAA